MFDNILNSNPEVSLYELYKALQPIVTTTMCVSIKVNSLETQIFDDLKLSKMKIKNIINIKNRFVCLPILFKSLNILKIITDWITKETFNIGKTLPKLISKNIVRTFVIKSIEKRSSKLL
jgi:hypothetical protein